MNILGTLSIAFVVVALAFIQQAFSIKCWECRSDLDPACGVPFDNSTLPLTDCNVRELQHLPGQKSHACRKITQNGMTYTAPQELGISYSIVLKMNGVTRIVRSCAFLEEAGKGADNNCVKKNVTSNVIMEYCTCDIKDGCNKF